MASAPRHPKKLTIPQFTRLHPEDKDWQEMQRETEKGNDRTVAIILVAFLEQTIERAILNRLVTLSQEDLQNLFYGDAPIGSFGAKVRLAYAMGIYGKCTLTNLQSLARIRNIFAHTPRIIKFDTPVVKDICDKISIMDDFFKSGLVDFVVNDMQNPRTKFVVSTMMLTLLITKAHAVELQHKQDLYMLTLSGILNMVPVTAFEDIINNFWLPEKPKLP